MSLVWNSFVYRKHAELLSSSTPAQYSPCLPYLVLGLYKVGLCPKLHYPQQNHTHNPGSPPEGWQHFGWPPQPRNTRFPVCPHSRASDVLPLLIIVWSLCPATAARDGPGWQMMIAVSNTGIGFLSGSVGGDGDTLSLTSMLYLLLPLLCIPSQLLFIH